MEIDYHHFRNVYSTNTWALQNASLLPRNRLTVIFADEQAAGRGRQANKWESPPFVNLYTTFGLFLPMRQDIPNLPQILALSAIEVLKGEGLEPRIKWPNDLYIEGKKIGGILSETLDFGSERFIAIGLGLNVNMQKEDLEKISNPATSLINELKKEFVVEALLKKIAIQFNTYLEIFIEKGFTHFLDQFKNSMILNQKIQFKDSRRKLYVGKGMDISADGSLKLLLENGDVKVFQSGELIEGRGTKLTYTEGESKN